MFTRQEIGDRLWLADDPLPTDATIKTHIRNLRCKLKPVGAGDLLQTHYGQGYCLKPEFDPGSVSLTAASPEPVMDSVTANIWQQLMTANARLQQEIDQRKQIEAQLRRSEALLREAQQAAHIGVWEFDVSTRQVYWTEELYHIHGLDPTGPPPQNQALLALIHPADHPIHEEAIVAPALKGQPFEANLRIIRQDGEIRYINARGGPVFNEVGDLIKMTGTTFDVTDWKQPKVRRGEAEADCECDQTTGQATG
jgi:PAS domain S-box-containing protein